MKTSPTLLCLATTAALSALIAPARAQNAQGPLTLSKAIEIALQRQPSLASATASRQASEARLKQSQSNLLPRVTPTYNLQAQTTTGTVNQILTGGVVVPVTTTRNQTIRQEDLSLTWRLFDSGTRNLNLRQARQNVEATTFAEANTRQTIIGAVADAYYSALRNDALVKVAAAQVERSKQTLDLIQAQIDAKLAATKDILQPQADYLNAQVSLLQAQNNAEIARAQLRNAMGVVENIALDLQDVTAPDAATPMTAQVTGLSPTAAEGDAITRLVSAAYTNRPDILQSGVTVASSATSVKLSKVAAGATITGDVSARYQFDAVKNPLDTIGNNRGASLSVSYPLFDGGLTRAGVRASEAQLHVSEAQLATQKQQVALDVEQAYRTLQQARASLPATVAAQAAAQAAFEKAQESKKEGVGSTVEIITAQTQLVQAQINYVQAIYNFYTADARLARAIGQAERIAASQKQ